MKAKTIIRITLITIFFLSSLTPGNIIKCQDKQNPLPQFLFPSFSKGIIIMKDGRKLSATLNYNIIDEEMIFQQGQQYMALDKPEEIDTVCLQNRKFVYIDKAFYEVVAEGKTDIYMQHKGKYVQEASNTAYGMKSPTNQNINLTTIKSVNQVRVLEIPENVTVSSTTVYWIMRDGELSKFNNQNQLLKLFSGSEEKIKEFIKTNNIDIKTREGLMNLGNFLNSTL